MDGHQVFPKSDFRLFIAKDIGSQALKIRLKSGVLYGSKSILPRGEDSSNIGFTEIPNEKEVSGISIICR